MLGLCQECGAPIPAGGSCRDNFHALLALESQVPGGPGRMAHFCAVSSYVLQHPDTMGYRFESLTWLRSAVEAALQGRVSIEELRRGARSDGKAAGRVLRRDGDRVQRWAVRAWTMNVADVLAGGVEGYGECVERWAASVMRDLDRPGS